MNYLQMDQISALDKELVVNVLLNTPKHIRSYFYFGHRNIVLDSDI